MFNVSIDYLLGKDVYVVSDNKEDYGIKLSEEELEFIEIIRKNDKLYDMLIEDPKRFIELLDKKLN